MRALSYSAAKAFTSSFSSTGTTVEGFGGYLRTSQTASVDQTKDAEFAVWRDHLLRDADRCLFMAFSCFASGLNAIKGGCLFWSGVSLYYSSFYSARALMAVFGCWMEAPKHWVEAASTQPNAVRLERRRKKYPRSMASGSHRIFWDAFYDFAASLTSYADPEQGIAITPVKSDPHWLIETRNRINYQPREAFSLMDEFITSFDPERCPGTIPGDLITLFRTAKAFLSFAKYIFADMQLATDVYTHSASRNDAVQEHIIERMRPEVIAFIDGEMEWAMT